MRIGSQGNDLARRLPHLISFPYQIQITQIPRINLPSVFSWNCHKRLDNFSSLWVWKILFLVHEILFLFILFLFLWTPTISLFMRMRKKIFHFAMNELTRLLQHILYHYHNTMSSAHICTKSIYFISLSKPFNRLKKIILDECSIGHQKSSKVYRSF